MDTTDDFEDVSFTSNNDSQLSNEEDEEEVGLKRNARGWTHESMFDSPEAASAWMLEPGQAIWSKSKASRNTEGG